VLTVRTPEGGVDDDTGRFLFELLLHFKRALIWQLTASIVMYVSCVIGSVLNRFSPPGYMCPPSSQLSSPLAIIQMASDKACTLIPS
jgi:hypothetical protein